MDDRKKIDLSSCEDYVLVFDDEAFIIKGLNKKMNQFSSDNIKLFFEFIRDTLQIESYEKNQKYSEFYEEWCVQGTECSILKPGKEWQKGKVRFTMKVEFFPDEIEVEKAEENGHQEIKNITESPLDEIRQQLTDKN